MASFDDFAARRIGSVNDGADALRDIALAKTSAAKTPPGADLSVENLKKAAAQGWTRAGGPKKAT